MATAFLFKLPGVTQQQCEPLMRDLNLGGHPAPGNHLHVAGPVDGGWWAFDVWESPERLQQYVNEALGPAMAKHHFPQIQLRVVLVQNMLR